MGRRCNRAVLVASILAVSVYAQEPNIETIITIMDAYEQRVDSVTLTYSCTTCREPDGNRELTKGVFSRKLSDGYVLLDEKKQQGTDTEWDKTKQAEGIRRAFDGEITRYFEHHTNKHGYHIGDVRQQHNPKFYSTRENPYLRVWGVNYKTRFTDLLRDPNAIPTVQGREIIDGSNALKVSFKSYSGSYDNNLWLLPEKNYLPIKLYVSRVTDGRRICEMHWGDYKQFGEDIWYPMEIKQYIRDSIQPTILRTEEIDFSPLSKEDFQFTFPSHTHVTDHVAGTSYLTTPTQEQSNRELTDMAELLREKEEMLDQYIEDGNSDDTEYLDGAEAREDSGHLANIEDTKKIRFFWTWVIILVFGVIGGVIIIARRRRYE